MSKILQDETNNKYHFEMRYGLSCTTNGQGKNYACCQIAKKKTMPTAFRVC